MRMEYDALNRISKVEKDLCWLRKYEYDGFGHQVRKEVLERDLEKQRVEEVQLPQKKIIEYMLDLTRSYYNRIKEQREKREMSYIWKPESYKLVGLVEEEESYFYQNDWLGSPVRLLDEEGKTVASYEYEEFGKRIEQRILQKEQPFGFIRYEKEEESELYHTERRWYNPAIGVFYGIDTIKGNTAEPFTIHAYLFCLNNPLHYIDVDGAYPLTEEEIEERKKDGIEAHDYLQQFFLWYYAGDPYITAQIEVKIPGVSLDPTYENGYCDMLLLNEWACTAQIYEIKPHTHDKNWIHDKDVEQLKKYITTYDEWKNIDTYRGDIFDPTGLLIPSKRNPNYYIRYYAHYDKEYNTVDETGKKVRENYQGFIYWEYVKKSNIYPEPYTIWIPNQNGRGGEFETDLQVEIEFEGKQNDDITAMIGLGVTGVVLWWLIKIALAGIHNSGGY